MTKTELKNKTKDELIDIILILDNKNYYKDGAGLVYREILKNKEKEIEKLLKNKDECINEVCEKIRTHAEVFGSGPTGALGYLVSIKLLDEIERGEI